MLIKRKIINLTFSVYLLVFVSNLALCAEGLPFSKLPLEAQNNLYYYLSVVDYSVEKSSDSTKPNEAQVKIKLTSNQANVMTDRPYREMTITSVQNFLDYVNKEEKNDLNLTLMVRDEAGSLLPCSFEQVESSFDPESLTLTFQAVLVDSTGVREWAKKPEVKILKGQYTTLMVEG